MKYTVSVIDTEEKFRKKFGSDPLWTISTPQNEPEKRGPPNIQNDVQPKKRHNQNP